MFKYHLPCPHLLRDMRSLYCNGIKMSAPHYPRIHYTISSLWDALEVKVLTPAVTKSSVFWVITPSSPMKINRRFGEQSSAFHLLSHWLLLRP
jgi:hypothetical protein